MRQRRPCAVAGAAGLQVAGADVSPVMIDLARQKAAAQALDVAFVVTGLDNLAPALPLPPSPTLLFDAVLCLGNSLPHLLTQDDLVVALRVWQACCGPAAC